MNLMGCEVEYKSLLSDEIVFPKICNIQHLLALVGDYSVAISVVHQILI
jgi:hypothetical protein